MAAVGDAHKSMVKIDKPKIELVSLLHLIIVVFHYSHSRFGVCLSWSYPHYCILVRHIRIATVLSEPDWSIGVTFELWYVVGLLVERTASPRVSL